MEGKSVKCKIFIFNKYIMIMITGLIQAIPIS